MAGKKTGKRLLTWVLVLVMALSLLPLNVLAASPAVMRIVRPNTDKYITYEFYNGEAKVDEQIIKTGDTLREPEVTVQDGKRLTGWYTENDTLFDGFGEYTKTIEKNSTVKLYAKFEDVYYVFFKDTTDRIVATKEGVTGVEIKFDDVSFPVESDESITGWYLEGDQGKTAVTSVTLKSTNVTRCAIVEKGHWITFDSKGGSYVEPQFVTGPTKAPTPPTKLGYTFAGWKNGDTAFTFGSALDADITLTAKWTAKDEVNYTVIHWLENADDDDYSYKESETLTGTAGELTEDAVDKSYEGFTLDKVEQKEIAGDGSTIVNVYYKRNVYNVTFASDTESGEDLICGKEAHKHTYAERTWFFGYKCKGGCYPSERYSRTPICGKEEHTHKNSCYGKLLKDLTITAKYGANISNRWPTYNGSSTWKTSKNGNTYQVNIDTMPLGGANFYGPKTGSGSQTAHYYVEVLPGESGTVENGVTYKLYRSDTSPGTGYDVTEEDKYPITGFTYKEGTPNGYAYDNAKFYYTRNSYDIIFINGGKTAKTESKKYQQDISTVSCTPTAPAGKDGYEFAGWFDNKLCEGTAYDFTGKTMPANNITLYAKWVEPVHTVTFMVGETTYKTMPDVAHKGTITLPAAPEAPDGDTFLGWVDANGKPFHPSTKITGDLTLYAKFGNKSGYSVTYVTAEGSSSFTDDKLYAEGAYATVRDGASTAPAGKVFLYWNAISDSSGKKYYPNDKVLVPKGGVTLMAVYGNQSETVTLTYHANYPEGSNPADQSYSYNNNERITVKANMFPVPTGYVFDKWTTAQNGGDTYNPDAPARVDSEGSNDLYARWAPNTDTKYTVEYYYQNADGSYPATASKTDDRTGTTGETAKVTAEDKADKEKGKYTYDSTAANKVESGTIAADGSLKLKLYFKLSKIDYTIEYYYEGQSTPFDKTTANVTYGTEVSEVNDSSNLKPHYSRTSVDPKLPVQINKAGIVIKVTYAKDPVGDGTFDFNDVDHSDDKATPAITKTVKGNVGKNFKETFKVTVEPKDNAKNTMTPDYYTGKAEVTYSDLKDIAFQFAENDKLTFHNAGKYTYTVREVPGGTSRMSYDTTEYTLTINVVLDADSNTYQVKSWQFTPGNRENLTQLNIVNTYRTYHPSTPSKPTLNTGDHYAYVMGYPDGTVRPNGSITRAEVSAILFRLLSDKTRDEYFTTESSFTDVKAGAWYNNSIATLEKAGVIVDTAKGGAFRPNEAITRAELAAMLAQFSDAKPVKGVKFSDVSAEHWAYEAIAIAAKMGWIEGYPDGTFRPDATITRAEMMTLVNRALERVPSDEDHLLSKRVMLTFPDCKSGDWFYIAVQEATNSHTYERAATEKNGDEQWTALRANRDWTLLEK
jgi:hypothetical protein